MLKERERRTNEKHTNRKKKWQKQSLKKGLAAQSRPVAKGKRGRRGEGGREARGKARQDNWHKSDPLVRPRGNRARLQPSPPPLGIVPLMSPPLLLAPGLSVWHFLWHWQSGRAFVSGFCRFLVVAIDSACVRSCGAVCWCVNG